MVSGDVIRRARIAVGMAKEKAQQDIEIKCLPKSYKRDYMQGDFKNTVAPIMDWCASHKFDHPAWNESKSQPGSQLMREWVKVRGEWFLFTGMVQKGAKRGAPRRVMDAPLDETCNTIFKKQKKDDDETRGGGGGGSHSTHPISLS